MLKKVYVIIVHLLAVLGLVFIYFSLSASLGVGQGSSARDSEGCRSFEGAKIVSPEGKRSIHAQFFNCSNGNNSMKVWLQPDRALSKYTTIFESTYNTDETMEIDWDLSGDIIISIPASVSPTFVTSDYMGLSIYVETKNER
ncbi:hypothetical protein BCS86_18275 [Vibrio splendidus]|nr:hypothetical protein BCS86_18275 [Vibrio splendidus]